MNAVNFDMYDAGELRGHPVVAMAAVLETSAQ